MQSQPHTLTHYRFPNGSKLAVFHKTRGTDPGRCAVIPAVTMGSNTLSITRQEAASALRRAHRECFLRITRF